MCRKLSLRRRQLLCDRAGKQDLRALSRSRRPFLQVCLLGRSRTYPPTAEASVDQQRTQYISRRRCPAGLPAPGPAPAPPQAEAGSSDVDHCPRSPPGGPGVLEAGAEGRWLPEFHPRDRAERVRNCTTLPREFVDRVVLQVANLLLGGERLSPGSPRRGTVQTWNRGGNALRAQPPAGSGSDALRRLAGGEAGVRGCDGRQAACPLRPGFLGSRWRTVMRAGQSGHWALTSLSDPRSEACPSSTRSVTGASGTLTECGGFVILRGGGVLPDCPCRRVPCSN